MKTLNLLQNMSAEAKVLAMALPMLLLGAMSAMAKQDEGCVFPEKMDMPHIIMQPGDSGRVQPVDYPDGSAIRQKLPGQKPEDAGIDGYQQNGKPFILPPKSPDSDSSQPTQRPDSANVEPDEKPAYNTLRLRFPGIREDNPQEDNIGPQPMDNPGDEDVYKAIPINGSQQYPAGIEEVAVDNQPAKVAQGVFTLSGLRVSDNADLSGLAPGLYIVNGKKMLVQ